MILEEEFLGVPKCEHPEFTSVNEECEHEGNDKVTF